MELNELAVTNSTISAPLNMAIEGEIANITVEGMSVFKGTVEAAVEDGFNIWQWDGHCWKAIHTLEDVLVGEEPVEDTLSYAMRFTKREMFEAALREYLDSYDMRTSAPSIKLTLDTNPTQVVEMVLKDVSEVDSNVCVYVGQPITDPNYGDRIYVLSKTIVSAEIDE
jgi:hypothetical protein